MEEKQIRTGRCLACHMESSGVKSRQRLPHTCDTSLTRERRVNDASVEQELESDRVHPLEKLNGYMNTVSGRKFNIFNPTPDMFSLKDIAMGLANKSHFTGQCPFYFSIAGHSMLTVSVLDHDLHVDPLVRLIALFHDAAEAYIGDMIKPIKVFFPAFSVIEDNIMDALFMAMGILPSTLMSVMERIKPADKHAQHLEYETFYKGIRSQRVMNYAFTPERSAVEFIQQAQRLFTILQQQSSTFQKLNA